VQMWQGRAQSRCKCVCNRFKRVPTATGGRLRQFLRRWPTMGRGRCDDVAWLSCSPAQGFLGVGGDSQTLTVRDRSRDAQRTPGVRCPPGRQRSTCRLTVRQVSGNATGQPDSSAASVGGQVCALTPGLPASAPGLGSPLPHLHRDWARPLATSAPGLGSPRPHLHRDWARPCHICTGTGLAPATSAPGLGSPLPHLRRDWAHRYHIWHGVDVPGCECSWAISSRPCLSWPPRPP
jgi:hypothetical protein